MLSRAQPRPADAPDLSLADMQNPMIDAYLAALPAGRTRASSRRAPPSSRTTSANLAGDLDQGRHAGQQERERIAGEHDVAAGEIRVPLRSPADGASAMASPSGRMPSSPIFTKPPK